MTEAHRVEIRHGRRDVANGNQIPLQRHLLVRKVTDVLLERIVGGTQVRKLPVLIPDSLVAEAWNIENLAAVFSIPMEFVASRTQMTTCFWRLMPCLT